MSDTKVTEGVLEIDGSVQGEIKHSSGKFESISCTVQQESAGISITFDQPGNPNFFIEIDDTGAIHGYVWPHEDAENYSSRLVIFQPRRKIPAVASIN